MNIRDFEYLVALKEHAHFGRAAKACFVSQPTLSAQIKKLEREIGLPLLERSSKGVVFTEAGLSIVSKSEKVLFEVKQMEELGQFYKDPRGGRMRIGLIPTIGPYLLPYILGGLRASFPRMKFYFHDLKTEEIIQKLDAGEIDAGILALPIPIEQFQSIPMYCESFYMAIHHLHPMKDKKRVQHSILAKENVMLLEDGHCFRDQALSICDSYQLNESSHFKGTSLETLKAMVQMGEGLTLVPELTKINWESQGAKEICFMPIENPIPQREIGFLFRKSSLQKVVMKEMAQLIQNEMEKVLSKTRKKREILPI